MTGVEMTDDERARMRLLALRELGDGSPAAVDALAATAFGRLALLGWRWDDLRADLSLPARRMLAVAARVVGMLNALRRARRRARR